MNSFTCWLTGGHRYSDENLTVYTDHKTDELVFQNFCVKCHKKYKDKIAWKYLVLMHEFNIGRIEHEHLN